MSEQPLLAVDGLFKQFPLRRNFSEIWHGRPSRAVQAARGISLRIRSGESYGLVGESGCGKTTLGRMLVGLITPDSGSITFRGQDVTSAASGERRALRRRIQMVFQDPYASLNPRLRVGSMLAEPIRLHRIVPPGAVQEEVTRLLAQVGLPADVARRYPSELSGGQRQRVGIARALALRPMLLVADEAVSGLDVSIRAQVLNLLDDLRRELGLALLFISHDLGVIEYLCETVAIMYLGSVMECGPTSRVFARPAHPYTHALLRAVPRASLDVGRERPAPLAGEPPNPADPPAGCAFRTRCPRAAAICATPPGRVYFADQHWSACHFATDVAGPVS